MHTHIGAKRLIYVIKQTNTSYERKIICWLYGEQKKKQNNSIQDNTYKRIWK